MSPINTASSFQERGTDTFSSNSHATSIPLWPRTLGGDEGGYWRFFKAAGQSTTTVMESGVPAA